MKSRRGFIKTGALATVGMAAGLPAISSAQVNNASQNKANDLLRNLPKLTREDYLDRHQKAKAWMQKMGVDALFVEGGVNMSYFMDVSWWSSERLFGFILSPHVDTAWICPAFEKKRAEEVVKFGNDMLIWHEHESPYKLLDVYLEKIGKKGGRVGIGPNVRNFVHEGFRRDSKAELLNGSVITENVRARKTAKEIEYMDVANRITKLAYKKGFDGVYEGMSPSDLSRLIRQAHSDMGVSGGGGPLFGENAAFPHGTKHIRNLREGDVILVDGGCSVNGYRSDVTRTIVLGKPSEKVKSVWQTVWDAQQAAFEIIKDGLPCELADKAARKLVEKAGYGSDYQYFTHRLGHGIGREGHEYPYLVRGNNVPMESGITFTNEPGLYLYGEFGVRIEDSFVVTDNGYKILGGMRSESIDKPFGADVS